MFYEVKATIEVELPDDSSDEQAEAFVKAVLETEPRIGYVEVKRRIVLIER